MMLRFTAVLLLLIGQAHARVEPGNWEFSVESPLQGNSGGPVTKQRCISPEEAGDPQKVLAEHVTDTVKPALAAFRAKLDTAAHWDRAAISAAMKATLAETKLKMPQLAMPLRILVTGRAQTPAIDAVLELLGRDKVLARLGKELS